MRDAACRASRGAAGAGPNEGQEQMRRAEMGGPAEESETISLKIERRAVACLMYAIGAAPLSTATHCLLESLILATCRCRAAAVFTYLHVLTYRGRPRAAEPRRLPAAARGRRGAGGRAARL